MAVPMTPLLGAPDSADALGQTMLSDDLIKGLRRINPNIVAPMPEHYAEWYPLKALGVTCLWLGKPGEGVKITAMRLGAIPEWTQTCPDGILTKGWRAIFEKVVRARAASRGQIEREFKISLAFDGKGKNCPNCFQLGERVRAVGASGLCDKHERQRKIAIKARQMKEERVEIRRRPPKRLGPTVFLARS